MTKEEAIEYIYDRMEYVSTFKDKSAYVELNMVKEKIEQLEERPKGEWIRMSNLSEQEDNRYKCSRCGNVVRHKNKMDLYIFNSWCGRCGSDNGK